MAKIAIIGFGNHVTKNILPAIDRLDELYVESIYVREPEKYLDKAMEAGLNLKRSDESVDEDVKWVYIATPISTHFELIYMYLDLGKNVICEKPLTDSSVKTKELFALAKNQGLQLHEVCMYKYHKQYTHLKNLTSEESNSLKSVNARFSIPHLDKNDIRYQKKLGGGSLLDVGYYPISLLMSLFGVPVNIKSALFGLEGYEVDLFGSAIFEYDGFYCLAEWGIGLPYSNEVVVITEEMMIKYERIFSKPETYPTKARIKEGHEIYDVDTGVDDHFLNIFRDLVLEESGGSLNTSEATIELSDVLNEIRDT